MCTGTLEDPWCIEPYVGVGAPVTHVVSSHRALKIATKLVISGHVIRCVKRSFINEF